MLIVNMGCTQSKDYQDGQSKLKPVPLITNSLPSDVKETIVFRGVFPNQAVLCRDEFQSKYTNELMYRWRPAEILKVEGDNRNRLLVHYSGWADTFDHWVDLEEESHKLAPEKLLSKDQCNRGGELTEEQIIITRDYFVHGKEYAPFVELVVPTAPVETTQTNTDLNTEELPAKKPELVTPAASAPVSVSLPNSNSLPAPVVAKRRSAGSSLLRPPGDDAESISGASIVSNVAIPKMPTSPPQMPPHQEQQREQQQQQFEQQRLAPPSSASKKILAPVRLVAPTEPNRRSYAQSDQVRALL